MVKRQNDSVVVGGSVYDADTGELVTMNIYIGNVNEIETIYGNKEEIVNENNDLIIIDDNGKIFIEFCLEEDMLFINAIGYAPAIFRIYDFIKDSDL